MGVSEDQPLAVQQWQGLIAINYPARKFGLNRHIPITEAKRLCPELICQHVATWKEGDEKWRYHEDAFAHISTHKVSLDPYRLESRRILACIKSSLPANLQKVEKASVDEVFLDLSAQVHSILLQRYPELALPAPYDDATENLPLPPTTALDWQADALVDLDSGELEEDDPDWDDIAILIGSEIVRSVRAAVREQLKYTCSAGVAQNKMLSKLGSAHKKPNQQSIIRNRAIQQFLTDFKFTKIRNLGGKLGEQVVATFNTDTVKDLLPVPIEQLKQKLGEDTGTWVYQIIRGMDSSEVNSRTQIKSMLSAKSFRPSINTQEQAIRWLRIFAADIYSRLVEEGVVANKRRPKTMNLHHRQGGQTRSRQAPIPQAKTIDEALLFDLAKSLLNHIILEGRVWPCANLSLSVGGFEDGITGNMGIGAFLVKGNEAKTTKESVQGDMYQRTEKRKRAEDGGIQRFFSKTDSVEEHDDDFGSQQNPGAEQCIDDAENRLGTGGFNTPNETHDPSEESLGIGPPSIHSTGMPQQPITHNSCQRCSKALESEEALQRHGDWHLAKDLQDQYQSESISVPPARPSHPANKKSKPSSMAGKRTGSSQKGEKGQSKLAFGR